MTFREHGHKFIGTAEVIVKEMERFAESAAATVIRLRLIIRELELLLADLENMKEDE